jgi:hypothetical protein
VRADGGGKLRGERWKKGSGRKERRWEKELIVGEKKEGDEA